MALGSRRSCRWKRDVAQLRLEAPVSSSPETALPCAGPGSRRWPAPSCSIDAPRGHFATGNDRRGWSVSWLTQRSGQFVAARVAREVAVRRRAFVKTRFGQQEIDAAAGPAVQAGTVMSAGAFLFRPVRGRAVQRTAALVDTRTACPEQRVCR